ncbi:hypothetical protein LPJ66_007166 [Kickxella alabastrina]|uniref:Uncharacterized protein n=1 Tax=Kickxella alabastrina TaxID=61397 RepID=A0ACC1IDG2_9FUNG|nr:hypothetical protein LPJ66_007166 [Kickxella alabastrina]
MLGVGGCSIFLFGLGLASLASGGLQLASYIMAAREVGLATLGDAQQQSAAIVLINPPVLVWFTLAACVLSLSFGLLFAMLDLVGMIVLRSRMWRHITNINNGLRPGDKGNMWDSYGNGSSARGDWWPVQSGKACMYGMGPGSESIAWWQKWMFLEELVYGVQRNMAFIRLGITTFLALVWSSTIIQLVIIGMVGKCHAGEAGDLPTEDTKRVCALLRQGMAGSIVTCACWLLFAMLLTFLNTSPHSSIPRLPLDHQFDSIPMNALNQGQGPAIPAALSSGSKHGPSLATIPTTSASGAPHQPMQMQPLANQPSSTASQYRKPGKGQFRSSWSRLDEESLFAESQRNSQGAQDRGNLMLQSQMIHQLYHLQSQQFQAQARLSEEHAGQKTARTGARKSTDASASTVPDQMETAETARDNRDENLQSTVAKISSSKRNTIG